MVSVTGMTADAIAALVEDTIVDIDFADNGQLTYTRKDGTEVDGGNAISSGISKTLVDAKGDLLVGSADDTVIRKAVGTDGAGLRADSSQPSGLRWSTRLLLEGVGTPEGVITAPVGSEYLNTATGLLYIKGDGVGNTGWIYSPSNPQPYITLEAAAATNVFSPSTFQKVNLATTVNNDGTAWYTVSNSVITVVQAGVYRMSAQAGINLGSSSGQPGIAITNAALTRAYTEDVRYGPITSATTLYGSVSREAEVLAAGTQLMLAVCPSPGSSDTTIHSAAWIAKLTITKIR